ncbi:NRAMP (natural resistance-associated macrophage protein) metal ion transporters [Variovorax sp. NFACC28]|nr:NRAMP (natural resistance-associated macrophage protein) metal ion transporters [Variovorax sp. NFACC28]SEG97770.1 NRAMP (natural resistance-associated macrophage protein) metal ion transporters [Variovorax sp. NFACC29]SFE00651.1 NRAMP (natural resistance-associated macrophage protein) metal ion transporters [Variovorax sp. NFACC26]SFH23125.1 NRAMP (natural resistance-associated macrophage protein) metal ion transporters [Variovorax sp. NFACC27]
MAKQPGTSAQASSVLVDKAGDLAPPDATQEEEPSTQYKQAFWNKLGPGLITGAADDDPSGIATYSQAGSKFGYDMGWTLLLTYPLMVGIQLASARIGRVSGRGLTEAFLRLWPRWVVWLLVGSLVVANVINLGADLNAMADVAALVAGGPKVGYAIGFGVLSLVLQIWLPYERYVRVLKWLTLSLLSYVAVAFTAHVDWAAAAKGALLPHLQWNKEFITTGVAILGTTISPYLFFWQASQEVEEIRRVPQDQALRRAPAQVPGQLRRLKIDTWVGMGFSNAIAFFMILATAATLHAHGQTSIETTAQAAQALKPVAGEAAFVLFGMGIVGTGLLALPVLAGSAAYALASLLGVRKGLDRAPGKAPAFYAILAAAMLIGLVIDRVGHRPVGHQPDDGAGLCRHHQRAGVGADHGRCDAGGGQPQGDGRTGDRAPAEGRGLGGHRRDADGGRRDARDGLVLSRSGSAAAPSAPVLASGHHFHLRHQLFLALRELLAHGDEVEPACRACLHEDLVALFLHVMVDVFAEHFHLGIEFLVDLGGVLELRNQILGAGVLHLGFIEQIGLLDGFSQGRIKDFFLEPCVHLQLRADLHCELALPVRRARGPGVGELVVGREKLLDVLVVGVEKAAGIGCGAMGCWHRGLHGVGQG